jgi:cytoskeletal protein CcmA (bactofilin family)
MVIQGTIEARGEVRFDGRLEGKISVSERLTVGHSGALVADVEANEVIVMGSIEGTIRAKRRLELKKGARVVGDVTTPILVIEEGVHFHGNSHMGTESDPASFLGTVAGGATPKADEDSSRQQIYQ